jgi:hypothetical protein
VNAPAKQPQPTTVVLLCSLVKKDETLGLGPTGVYGRSITVPASVEEQKFLFLHLLGHGAERDVIGMWCESV